MEVLARESHCDLPWHALRGRPYDGDTDIWSRNDQNPWESIITLVKTAVFCAALPDESIREGPPIHQFHVSGKNDIIDPQQAPTVAYPEKLATLHRLTF